MIAYKLIGIDRMIREVKRIGSPPAFPVIGELESITASGYAATQAAVHVITGSLKASGRPVTDFDGWVWSGAIVYGGPSTGVNNPVDYAVYELARGGTHYWFSVMDTFEKAYEDAVLGHFKAGA